MTQVYTLREPLSREERDVSSTVENRAANFGHMALGMSLSGFTGEPTSSRSDTA